MANVGGVWRDAHRWLLLRVEVAQRCVLRRVVVANRYVLRHVAQEIVAGINYSYYFLGDVSTKMNEEKIFREAIDWEFAHIVAGSLRRIRDLLRKWKRRRGRGDKGVECYHWGSLHLHQPAFFSETMGQRRNLDIHGDEGATKHAPSTSDGGTPGFQYKLAALDVRDHDSQDWGTVLP